MITLTDYQPSINSEEPHNHICHYIKTNNGMYEGQTSEDDGHFHFIETRTNPETGEVMLVAVASEEVSHEHILATTSEGLPRLPKERAKKEKKKKFSMKTHNDRVSELLELHSVLKSTNIKNIERGIESVEFYSGEQWGEEEREELYAQDRACLTINKTEKYIDEICGYGDDNETDAVYEPRADGKKEVAEIAQILKRQIEADNRFRDTALKNCFFDFATIGWSNIHYYIDYDSDVYGQIKIERFPFQNVYYGTHKEGEFPETTMLWEKITYQEAVEQYPEAKERIEKEFRLVKDGDIDSAISYLQAGEDYPIYDNYPEPLGKDSYVEAYDQAIDSVLVVEVYRTVFYDAPIIIDLVDGNRYDGYDFTKADLKRLKEFDDLVQLVPRKKKKLRKTVMVGGAIVEDIQPVVIPDDKAPVFPVYAKRVNDKVWGKVYSAKDAQMELNKRRSQSIDIANSSSGRGFFYDESTFGNSNNGANEGQFLEDIAKPSFAIKVASLDNIPVQVSSPGIPQGITQTLINAEENLQEIMNVKVVPTGSHQSHAHFLEQKKTMLVGNAYLFSAIENLLFYHARRMLYWIQMYVNPETAFKMLNIADEEQINGKPVTDYTEQEVIQLLSDADFAKYGVNVIKSKFSETARIATLGSLTELRQAGVAVPDSSFIELQMLPKAERAKMAQAQELQQQQMAENAKVTAQSEENKTLIAKDIIPPAVQRRLEKEAIEVDREKAEEQRQQNLQQQQEVLQQ